MAETVKNVFSVIFFLYGVAVIIGRMILRGYALKKLKKFDSLVGVDKWLFFEPLFAPLGELKRMIDIGDESIRKVYYRFRNYKIFFAGFVLVFILHVILCITVP